jgi:probable phosphoglycerate mutase
MPIRLFLLRHGQSRANVEGLVASSLATAGEAYGLTPRGREQVRSSIGEAAASGILPQGCLTVSSPLLRARESAEVAAEVLGGTVRLDHRLIERGFGSLERGPDAAYEGVWAEDRADPGHERWGVESVRSVLDRGSALLRELERSADVAILCTHGDVASVLLCASLGLPLGRHREVGALGNGELRAVGPGMRPGPVA